MKVHLVDGTYELFRHYYALPSHVNAGGQEVAATRGVVASILSLLAGGATHVAVATDHVVESFRNELWPDYKDATGIEPELFSQFGLVEDAVWALGVPVWAMVEYEADDGLAAGAAMAAADERVGQVLIWGLSGWGAKSASTVLARYLYIEEIPEREYDWDVSVRGAARLAATLREEKELALLFRRLATLVREAPVSSSVDELEWRGPTPDFAAVCETLEDPRLVARAEGG